MLRRPEALQRAGVSVFRRIPVNRVTVQGWLKTAGVHLVDARQADRAARQRVKAAVDAVVYAGLAVLASNGWHCLPGEGYQAPALEAALSYAAIPAEELEVLRDLLEQLSASPPAREPTDVELTRALDSMDRLVPRFLSVLSAL